MGFQKQVYGDMAVNRKGMWYSYNARATTTKIAGKDVQVGDFVWEAADGTVSNSGTGAPLGMAMGENETSNREFWPEASMIIPKGHNVLIATKGEVTAEATTAAAVKQAVFVLNANGKMVIDDPDATVAGATQTSWRVIVAGDTGETIAISTWRD